MAVEIEVAYQGNLHTQATHGPSGKTLVTDAPVDNGGKGESFSPTDLVATALGTCTLTVIGIVAQRNNLDVTGIHAHVVKEMVTQPKRRIGTLRTTITFPHAAAIKLSTEDRKRLEQAAHHCPVHQSLLAEIDAPITFVYEG